MYNLSISFIYVYNSLLLRCA